MNVRHIALVAAIVVACSPQIAAASPGDASLQACLHAFAAKLAAPGAVPAKYRLAFANAAEAGVLNQAYAGEFTFTLAAHDPKSGATTAQATCTADRSGVVTSLHTEAAAGR